MPADRGIILTEELLKRMYHRAWSRRYKAGWSDGVRRVLEWTKALYVHEGRWIEYKEPTLEMYVVYHRRLAEKHAELVAEATESRKKLEDKKIDNKSQKKLLSKGMKSYAAKRWQKKQRKLQKVADIEKEKVDAR